MGSFDHLDHPFLLRAIGNFPARELIKQWLKAGYVEEEIFHPTDTGVPQGGTISPLLLNVALHGMEQAERNPVFPVKIMKVEVSRYEVT